MPCPTLFAAAVLGPLCDPVAGAPQSFEVDPVDEVVTVDELVEALELVVPKMASSEALQADFKDFVLAHELEASEELYDDYVRVKLAFEATRDGGWWNLRWDITNEKPNSEKIWAQWSTLEGLDPDAATATAECDELSALFAFFTHRLGVDDVGLFWPTGNHVVAVWTVDSEDGPVRIVVPTSQIFLDANASLGTDGFDPWTQKSIFDYRRKDVRGDFEIPTELAEDFVRRAWVFSSGSQAQQQRQRNARSLRLDGS